MRSPYLVILLLVSVSVLPSTAQEPAPATPPAPPTPPPTTPPPTVPPPAVTLPAQPAGRPITLAEAIQLAIANHTSLPLAVRNVDIAQARVLEARAGQIPRVNAAAELDKGYTSKGIGFGGTGGTARQGNQSEQHRALVTVRQNFFDTFQTPTRVRQARAGVTGAQGALATTRQNLVMNVTQAYLAVLQARALEAVSAVALTRAQTELARVQAFVEAETLARREILRAEADVAAAQVDVIRSRRSVDDALAVLKNAIGVPQDEPLDPSQELLPTSGLPDLDTVTAEALRLRPEVVEDQAQLASAEAARKLAKIQRGPVLSVDGAVDLQVHPNPISHAWSVNAMVGYPIFDLALMKARVREAEAAVDVAKLRLEQTRRDITLEVKQAYLALQEAQARIEASTAAVAAAQANLEAQIGSFEAGVVILLEVTQAREQLTQAESNRVLALHDANLALAGLNRAIGRDPAQGLNLGAPGATEAPAAPAAPAGG